MDSITMSAAQHGLGPVVAEAERAVFSCVWEGRMHGIVGCVPGPRHQHDAEQRSHHREHAALDVFDDQLLRKMAPLL